MNRKTVAFSKDSSNLFFHILTKCNLSCRHCYINPDQHGRNTLKIETIRRWLNLFAGKCDRINVIFLGGEPTMHPDLSEAVKEARRLGFKSITIDTNGYLFHDILEKITPEDVDFISFSLDGATEATNDYIRGEGTYRKVLSGVKKAVDAGFSTSMIYTVSTDNLFELPMMPALVKDLGIERLFIQVIGIRGASAASCPDEIDDKIQGVRLVEMVKREGSESSRQVSMQSWLDTVPVIAEEIASYGITVTYPKVFLGEGDEFQCAGLVADNYFIFPNGRVYRCPLCEDYPVHGLEIEDGGNEEDPVLKEMPKINECDLFNLNIPEGCVMNRLIQPGNITYKEDGSPSYRIACCMLKEEISLF